MKWIISREIHYTKIDTKGDRNLTHLNFHRIKQSYLPKPPPKSEVIQSCPTLCDPMDCSLPGSSIHGILQARILEWIVISFSRGSSKPRDWTWVSCIAGRLFTIWTREPSQNHLPKLPLKNHWDQMVPTDNFTKSSNPRQSQCFKNLLESLENQGLFLILFIKQV